jgi:ribosomal protein S18 acetylase RimI-like enzyme
MAGAMYEVARVPGFSMFFHPTDDMTHVNYTIPDADWQAHAAKSLVPLRGEFESRDRRPRFEFMEEYAPDLPAALRNDGYTEEYRGPAMLCLPDTLAPAPAVPGLAIDVVGCDASDDALVELARTQRAGFGASEPWNPDESDMAHLRAFMVTGCGFLGRLDGRAVAGAQLTPPHDSLAELAGIATLERYRRRGIASALTSAATAHASGMDGVCLSAGDESSSRVYERVGYRIVATMLAYSVE